MGQIKRKSEGKVWTLPNVMSISRILLLVPFAWAYLHDMYVWAIVILLISGITDIADGFIARRFNMISTLGKVLDPLADKILVLSALLCMIEFGWVSSVAVIVIIAREFMVTGLRTVAMGSGKVIAAGFSGKLKTVIQIVTVVLIMFVRAINIDQIAIINIIVNIAIWLTVFITVYSGAEYIIQNWSVIDFKK